MKTTIIDRINVTQEAYERAAAASPRTLAPGLWFVLEPAKDLRPPEAGESINVTTPDGLSRALRTKEVMVSHGVIALAFEGASDADVPRLSIVEWASK